MLEKFSTYKFLFEELVKRDFKQKYKRTVLGMFWSILSPLLMLCVMATIFGNFFGRSTNYYVIYLFSGLVVFNYFTEATNSGMNSLMNNARIFSKINVPKHIFLLSRNVSSLINFGIVLVIYFMFVLYYGLPVTWKYVLLLYPIINLIIINIGVGLILSALYVFFRDIQYLYSLFTRVIMYGSAIFYNIDGLPVHLQKIFYFNPIYLCITYFRSIVIYNDVPALWIHLIMLGYACILLGLGFYVYRKFNYKFIYYI